MKNILLGLILAAIVVITSFVVLILSNKKSVQVVDPVIKTGAVIPIPTDTYSPPVINELTLDYIFSKFDTSLYNPEKLIKITATGDYGVVREVNYKTISYNNFKWAVEEFAHLLSESDIALINLEGPLVNNCPIMHSGFTFCGETKHVEGLLHAGIDVVNVANNHAGNFNFQGVNETVDALSKENILISGLHENNIVYKNVKGTNIAFLGYNDIGVQVGTATADFERLQKEITQAKENADIVIVSMHWGNEYTTTISSRQKEIAYLAIDSGADLIVGNHPHWIQPVEIYKNKLITYAHGNFIFDQMWSEETREGVVGEYYFYENRLVGVNFNPVYIVDYGKATVPDSLIAKRILDRLQNESYNYAGLDVPN